VTAADDAREALRLARQALLTAEAAARAAGVEVEPGAITAERINLVGADGGLRLVITASTHEIYARGQVVRHPNRTQPGLIFVSEEGTECGGIVWDAEGGGLTFDSHEQDQAIAMIHTDVDGVRTSALEFVDRPTSSMVEALLGGHVGEDPEEAPVRRMRLAKEPDGSVGLTFRDQEGRERMRLGLDKHGHPSVELLGPNGGHAGGIG
jgi:hypothetical protein